MGALHPRRFRIGRKRQPASYKEPVDRDAGLNFGGYELFLVLCAVWAYISTMATLTKPHEKRKDDRLVARVSHEDKAVITKGAVLAGQTVGGFLLEHARKAAS